MNLTKSSPCISGGSVLLRTPTMSLLALHVVQVDNALLSKLPAGIEASCEHWSDSTRNWFSALHVKPTGSRVETLQALSDARGDALSVPWLQTASRRMVSDGLEKFISCCATVSSWFLALTDAMLEAKLFVRVLLRLVCCQLPVRDRLFLPLFLAILCVRPKMTSSKCS